MLPNWEKIADKFHGDIPCGECYECEEGADFVVVYPGEREVLERINFPSTFMPYVVDSFECMVGECKACSPSNKHYYRPKRPVDCKTYPYAVIILDGKFKLCVSKLCPLWDNLPESFTEEVKYVWEHLLTFREVLGTLIVIPINDFNEKLDWVEVDVITPTYHPELD